MVQSVKGAADFAIYGTTVQHRNLYGQTLIPWLSCAVRNNSYLLVQLLKLRLKARKCLRGWEKWCLQIDDYKW